MVVICVCVVSSEQFLYGMVTLKRVQAHTVITKSSGASQKDPETLDSHVLAIRHASDELQHFSLCEGH